jgi:hypothetical protein
LDTMDCCVPRCRCGPLVVFRQEGRLKNTCPPLGAANRELGESEFPISCHLVDHHLQCEVRV